MENIHLGRRFANFMIDMQNKSYHGYLFLMEENMPCVCLKINNYSKCVVQKQIITWENMKMKEVMLQGFTHVLLCLCWVNVCLP
jgi:hypothetical protein